MTRVLTLRISKLEHILGKTLGHLCEESGYRFWGDPVAFRDAHGC